MAPNAKSQPVATAPSSPVTPSKTSKAGGKKKKGSSKNTEAASLSAVPLPNNLLAAVVSYLPLSDMSSCRTVTKAFGKAVDAECEQSGGMIFLRYNGLRNGAQVQARNALRWVCPGCKTSNNVAMAVCRRCGERDYSREPMRRVFFGQLPKERATEAADWLIARMFPDLDVFHIEAHTTKDGRSKGCAWIYLNKGGDEAPLLALNRRVFVDIDANRREGMYIASPSHTNELQDLAANRSRTKNRPSHLPRQPLVVEMPVENPEIQQQTKCAMPPMPVGPDRRPQGYLQQDRPPQHYTHIPQPRTIYATTLTAVEKGCAPRKETQPSLYRHDPYSFNPIPAGARISVYQ